LAFDALAVSECSANPATSGICLFLLSSCHAGLPNICLSCEQEAAMTTATFDTLGYFEKLKAAGVPEEQAKAITGAQAEAMKDFVASRELATKADLAELKNDMLRWMVGGFIAQTALIIAVLALMR